MKLFNFCMHTFGKVEKDGYQYCIKCGTAKAVPVLPIICEHEYGEQIVATSGRFGMANQLIYIDTCVKCGHIRKQYVNP